MLKFLRYALAIVCFSASVGCLALWGWALQNQDQLLAARFRLSRGTIVCQIYRGGTSVARVFVPVRYSGASRFGVPIVGSTPLVKDPVNVSLQSLTLPLRLRENDRWYIVNQVGKHPLSAFGTGATSGKMFGRGMRNVHFPLWYPALVFALAGVGALRVGRFTIRSALITTTIVAVLLGMVVAL